MAKNRSPLIHKGASREERQVPIMIANVVPNSIQDALRMFMPPIKSEDPRVDFYTMYKREAVEYDNDYVRKYDEDLNITLIFVRLHDTSDQYTTHHLRRPVCSWRSARPSPSVSNQCSCPTLLDGPRHISAQSSSASTEPSSRAKIPQLPLHGQAPRMGSSPLLFSSTQVC